MQAQPEFQIFNFPFRGGTLGLSQMPGREGDSNADIQKIVDWGTNRVLTMTTGQELVKAGTQNIQDALKRQGVFWHFLPIVDFGAPDAEVAALWQDTSGLCRKTIEDGGKILAHCWGGQGRSGMILLRLMVEMGQDPNVALAQIRSVRPGAVETDAQFAWASQPY